MHVDVDELRVSTAGPESTAAPTCFHCGERIAAGVMFTVRIDGADRMMCCLGCRAVAQSITDSGLERYYRLRESKAAKPAEPIEQAAGQLEVFDDLLLQSQFVEGTAGTARTASLILDGIHCPACCWLIEKRLSAMPGMRQAIVNFASQRATVSWDAAQLRLSAILKAVARLGYRAHPYDPRIRSAWLEAERKRQQRRLGLAGLLGMQVMMLSLAFYFTDWPDAEQVYREFFRWTALLLTVPVVFYSADAFFRNAWRDLRSRRAGMDIPVSLGILLAFLGSVEATVTGRGPVYFDSVVMFVFILLLGRYVEFRARGRALSQLDHLARVLPAMATRLERAETGLRERAVPVVALCLGDTVLVRPGETIPADGTIVEGQSSVEEALLTGEGLPRRRGPGDPVIGGSTNCESPIHVRVDRVGAETVLSRIARLVDQSQSQKPALTLLADGVATWFVYAVLILAAGVGGYWSQMQPSQWLPITVSVLVVSCPCALALAVPSALAGAIARCMRGGIVVAKANAIETLHRVSTFVFDKTGTLTLGRLVHLDTCALAERSEEECLAIAGALEHGSEHPIARALRAVTPDGADAGSERRNYPGEGMAGMIDDTPYFLGSAAFIRRMTGLDPLKLRRPAAEEGIGVTFWLANPTRVLAAFSLGDELRADANALVAWIVARGCKIVILSGDTQTAVDALGALVGVQHALGGCLPEHKVEWLRRIEEQGEVVCVIGDGINDAPVLAQAHVSVAMADATDMAQASADLILPEGKLASLRIAVETAARAIRIIRQNVAWAIGYNLLALPLAAAGAITPWMAALGMSLSSLIVIINSTRLGMGRTG
ncbi:MAG: heavy metal translocating P-type ATPase [Gammaproteobacteria bacterium]|nr:heavy metal translocating P-type ATPase [Gammaproteobacteria bacterium]